MEEAATNTRHNTLPNLPGFDLEDALNRLRGKQDRLTKIFISFAERNKDSATILINFIHNNELTEAERLAHQLKGSGANLGAIALSKVAGNIEDTLSKSKCLPTDQILEELTICLNDVQVCAKKLGEIRDA